MPFASSWHNVVLLELSTLFAELRLIFVSFSHFSLNFCIVSFPFFAYNKLNTTFWTDSSPPGDPWKEFYHMKHSKKLVTLSVLTTMSGAAIYFLNKTLDTAAVRKNLLASAEKESFSLAVRRYFLHKKRHRNPDALTSWLTLCLQRPRMAVYWGCSCPGSHRLHTRSPRLRPFRQAGDHVHELFIRTAHRHLHQTGHRMSNRRNCIRFIRLFRCNRLQYSPEMLRPNHDDQPDRPCQAQQNPG